MKALDTAALHVNLAYVVEILRLVKSQCQLYLNSPTAKIPKKKRNFSKFSHILS
jgi:hypothetical protein